MEVESEDGRRQSVAERIQANMERSALRREVLRHSRAEKRRQSIPRVEKLQDSGEEVCIVSELTTYASTDQWRPPHITVGPPVMLGRYPKSQQRRFNNPLCASKPNPRHSAACSLAKDPNLIPAMGVRT